LTQNQAFLHKEILHRPPVALPGTEAEPTIQRGGTGIVVAHLQRQLAVAAPARLGRHGTEQAPADAAAAPGREHREVVNVRERQCAEGREARETDRSANGLAGESGRPAPMGSAA